MTTSLRDGRGWNFATLALVALVALAPGCGGPPDEAWLRVLCFEESGSSGSGDSCSSGIASFTSHVHTTTTTSTTTTTELGTTDYVSVVFANQSVIIKGNGIAASGVTVTRVRISYDIAGYAPPSAAYGVTLYIPGPDPDSTSTSSGVARLQVALVSTALKSWLAATVPSGVIDSGLHASALLVFSGVTDEGGDLETEARIGIVFENETLP